MSVLQNQTRTSSIIHLKECSENLKEIKHLAKKVQLRWVWRSRTGDRWDWEMADPCSTSAGQLLIFKMAELIEPAVKGTLNILGSCPKTPSVKRVVVTSSIAAVSYNGKPRTPEVVVDETWFTDAELCKKINQWYVVSKTLAEEAAWKFAKEHGIDTVTINLAMVIGPLLQPTLNTSAEAVLNLINDYGWAVPLIKATEYLYSKTPLEQLDPEKMENGSRVVTDGARLVRAAIISDMYGAQTYVNAALGWVDVRDVAKAHILAYEVPTASGRYCLVERVAHYSEVVEILRKLYPGIPLPEKCADDKPFAPTYQVSKKKAESLGIDFTPVEVSFKDTVESLKEKNFVGKSSI